MNSGRVVKHPVDGQSTVGSKRSEASFDPNAAKKLEKTQNLMSIQKTQTEFNSELI
jgi:hypothetical protein